MNDEFAVFIMVWGRPNKVLTYNTLRRQGYTGKIYFVADDQDVTLKEYKNKYKEDLLVFSKDEVKVLYDAGDNTGDLRSTLYAANYIRNLAGRVGVKYYAIFCDDYTGFSYKHDNELNYLEKPIKDLDKIFELMLAYYKKINALTIAMLQTGDYVGGKNSTNAKRIRLRRKAMNTFICSVDRPFNFMGRMNEDVTTYVNLGNKGNLFLSVPNIAIHQTPTQSEDGGLKELYLDYGTYVKTFFSVMYNPSCVKVGLMGSKYKRLHHKVSWNNAVPRIIKEEYKKPAI